MKKYLVLFLLLGSLLYSCVTVKNECNYNITNYDRAKIVRNVAFDILGDSIPPNDAKHNYPLVEAKDLIYKSEYLLKNKDYCVDQDSLTILHIDNYYYLTMIEIELYKNNPNLQQVIERNYTYFVDNLEKLGNPDSKYITAKDFLGLVVEEIKRIPESDKTDTSVDFSSGKLLSCGFKNLPYISIILDLSEIINYKEDLKRLKIVGIESEEGKLIKKKLEKRLTKKVLKRILGGITYFYDVMECLFSTEE